MVLTSELKSLTKFWSCPATLLGSGATLRLTGVLRYEDNFSLALQMEDGRYHLLARSDLTDVHYTDHSLMPPDYGTRLTSKELNDLVSFLIVTSRSGRRGR